MGRSQLQGTLWHYEYNKGNGANSCESVFGWKRKSASNRIYVWCQHSFCPAMDS